MILAAQNDITFQLCKAPCGRVDYDLLFELIVYSAASVTKLDNGMLPAFVMVLIIINTHFGHQPRRIFPGSVEVTKSGQCCHSNELRYDN